MWREPLPFTNGGRKLWSGTRDITYRIEEEYVGEKNREIG